MTAFKQSKWRHCRASGDIETVTAQNSRTNTNITHRTESGSLKSGEEIPSITKGEKFMGKNLKQ